MIEHALKIEFSNPPERLPPHSIKLDPRLLADCPVDIKGCASVRRYRQFSTRKIGLYM